MPAIFDAPLAPHHRLIGRWIAARDGVGEPCTRPEARRRIERAFGEAVAAILGKVEVVELRVMVMEGEEALPPALAIVCDTVGQIDLGWIEKNNVLSNALVGPVAPVGWRAAAYRAIEATLGCVLGVIGYADMLEELSAYHWEGATDDAGARAAMIEWRGYGEDEVDPDALPSGIAARRPDWMTGRPAPLKDMPPDLRHALRRLREAHTAAKAAPEPSAWRVDRDRFDDYMPGLQDRSHLPPITIVPADQFGRELDDIAHGAMELGFDDVAGLCQLTDDVAVDAWFATLRLGAEYLLALQALIDLDPAKERTR